MFPLNDFDLGFIVGILEGEGSFSNPKEPIPSREVRITVNMSDLDVIKRIAKLLGVKKIGSYDPNKYRQYKSSAKIMYYIALNGNKAIEIMKMIYPYMGKRRKIKIKELIKNRTKPADKVYGD